jgi:very-short-patch-repair endonuclease
MYCLECDCPIQRDVFNYSNANFGVSLCRPHQNWIKQHIKSGKTTAEAFILYFALREFGVNAELEKYDGFKTIDIAIEEAKVHIEVDGRHHNSDSRQALADLKRTYYSFKKGYFTLRIPNSLIRNDLDDTVDYVIDLLELNRQRIPKKGFSIFKLFG